MGECQLELKAAGKPYPRTCAVCGLAKCHKGLGSGGPGAEGSISPMGWFYRVDPARVGVPGNPSVYRCKLGEAWERMEIFDLLASIEPAELRFLADIIDASKSKAA